MEQKTEVCFNSKAGSLKPFKIKDISEPDNKNNRVDTTELFKREELNDLNKDCGCIEHVC